jgi:hypothetical protein
VVHNSFSIMVVEEEARGCISILAEFIYLLVLICHQLINFTQ